MSDEFIPLDELGERTSAVNSDLMHIRSTGKIDSKISVTNFLKSVLDSVRATFAATIANITTANITTSNETTANITTGNITTNNVTAQNMTGQMKWKHYYKAVGVTQAVVFTELSSWLGGTNSYMAAHMQFKSGGNEGGGGVIISKGSTTVVGVDFVDRLTVSITHENFQNGSGTIVDYIEIMSNFDAIT